jgi:hypothetical protein
MMPEWAHWLMFEMPLFAMVIIGTHLTVSCGQTVLHHWLGHKRFGGRFFRNHINFHHTFYARGQLESAIYRGSGGNNTPFFLVPIALIAAGLFFVLPTGLFLALILASGASFGAHVVLDRAYHVKGSWLTRFAWFRHKQQLHFVHHLHANANFAVMDFFWDRAFRTFRKPDSKRP